MGERFGRRFGVVGLVTVALAALIVGLTLSLNSGGGAPANASVGETFSARWGDLDCSGTVDVLDVLAIERRLLGLPQSVNDCEFNAGDASDKLHIGDAIKSTQPNALVYGGIWGDLTCDRNIDDLDALSLLRWMANIGHANDDSSNARKFGALGCQLYDTVSTISQIPVYPLPSADPIGEVAVDTNVAGNAATSTGPTDSCVEVPAGAVFDVDIVIKGIPTPLLDTHGDFTFGGLSSFSLDAFYDPAVIHIVGEDPRFILQGLGTPHLVDSSNSIPDADGRYHTAVYDTSEFYEYGNGVLVRLTVQAVASGTSQVLLVDPNAVGDKPRPADALNTIYDVTSVKSATIHVDSTCPGPETPTPTPTPTATPTPTPTATPAPTDTITPTPSPSPSPGPTEANSCLNVQPPKTIPDNDSNGIDIPRTEISLDTVSSLNVCLDIAHEWAGDLVVTLKHEQTGTTRSLVVRLGNHVGSCSGNGNGVYVLLTDQLDPSRRSMEDACSTNSDIIGTFYPEQPLADGQGTFAGEQIAGDWTLNVRDLAQGRTGEVRGFSLQFNGEPLPTSSPSPTPTPTPSPTPIP